MEQVSHHPPISACRAESPKWDYYGENAVDSKFYGRSFDFKHLGKMFCVIRPDKGVRNKNGELVEEELYSWKKLTLLWWVLCLVTLLLITMVKWLLKTILLVTSLPLI